MDGDGEQGGSEDTAATIRHTSAKVEKNLCYSPLDIFLETQYLNKLIYYMVSLNEEALRSVNPYQLNYVGNKASSRKCDRKQ